MELSQRVAFYRDDMVRLLGELVAVPSVEQPADGPYPFGKPVDDCLRLALERAKELGFRTGYVDGYAGWAEVGQGEKTMGILVHLDVVPAPKEGWDTDPFTPVVKDGRLYGRGASDNKGAAVAVLYAIRACMDLGVEFKNKIRVIFGCDEESGWECMKYYQKHYAMPDFGFSPDASFPVINGEKGIYQLEVAVPMRGDDFDIVQICAGDRPNVVCPLAEALVRGEAGIQGPDTQIFPEDGNTRVRVRGKAAHGSTPQNGRNAAVALMRLLRASGRRGNAIDLACDLIGDDYHGGAFGVGFEDAPSGKLTLNLGMIRREGDQIVFTLDIRYPVTVSLAQVQEGLTAKAAAYGATLRTLDHKAPIYLPKDHFLIKSLLEAYTQATGREGYTVTIGGGTYARAMQNAVAFGPIFPEHEEDERGVHGVNEFCDIGELVRAAQIYALVASRQ